MWREIPVNINVLNLFKMYSRDSSIFYQSHQRINTNTCRWSKLYIFSPGTKIKRCSLLMLSIFPSATSVRFWHWRAKWDFPPASVCTSEHTQKITRSLESTSRRFILLHAAFYRSFQTMKSFSNHSIALPQIRFHSQGSDYNSIFHKQKRNVTLPFRLELALGKLPEHGKLFHIHKNCFRSTFSSPNCRSRAECQRKVDRKERRGKKKKRNPSDLLIFLSIFVFARLLFCTKFKSKSLDFKRRLHVCSSQYYLTFV